MIDSKLYTYRVTWSDEDQEYVGLCVEFPGLSYLDEDHAAAFNGVVDLVRHVIEDMEANAETVPEPLSKKEYSGRFQVRVPPELHRRLATEAAEQSVSLNRLISSKLAS